jgi:glycosyltransferase involved in cell wall biosynthesis
MADLPVSKTAPPARPSPDEGKPEPRTAFIATYPPRRCGIAAFTKNLADAVGDGQVWAIHHAEDQFFYPPEVTHLIRRDVRADYLRAVAEIHASKAQVVSIQHEYGIFGGQDGDFILDLLERLEIPSVATLHTVLREPTDSQHRILVKLLAGTRAVVVMSREAASLLHSVYGASASRIRVIPHGVPDLDFVEPDLHKADFALADRSIILSFGLLGPGKGYESVIRALPQIAREHPDVLYVILGATHPDLLQLEGEAYRERLHQIARDSGVSDQVLFVDRFVDLEELGRWLQAANVFVTPYPNLEQIVSGSLSYALAAGRPAVSTPYAYANEVLSDGRGLLVEPDSVPDLARALSDILGNADLQREMGQRAHLYSRPMIWRNIGAAYRTLFGQVIHPQSLQDWQDPDTHD